MSIWFVKHGTYFSFTDVLFINVAYQCMFFDRHLIFFPQHKCMCTQSQAHSGHMFHYMDLGSIHQYLKSIKYIHVKRITFGQRVRFFKIALNFVFYLRKRNRRTLFFNVIQNKCSIKMFQHTATISDLYWAISKISTWECCYVPSQVYPEAFSEYPASQKQYSDPSGLTPHCWEQFNVVLVHSVMA